MSNGVGPDPAWQLADFFALDGPQTRTLKIKLASHLGLRWGPCNQSKAFARGVGSTAPYDTTEVRKLWEDHNARMATGSPDPSGGMSSVTINACQVRWETSAAKNVGYILTSCTKYLAAWDPMIERRAGGVIKERFEPHDEQELTHTKMSSLLRLVAHVVFQYKTLGKVDDRLAEAFSSVRVAIYYGATSDEVRSLNFHENVEQRQRKAHCELDNIECVRQWRQSMKAFAHCDPENGVDLVKYALCVSDLRTSGSAPPWMRQLLGSQPPTLENKLAVMRPLNVKAVKELKGAVPAHPQMNSYSAIMLRQRFLKGFSEDGIRGLHELLYERMGKEGIADKPLPIPSTILMSPDILTSTAFSTSAEKDKVPAWRDGALGTALQRRMPDVAARRYFDHGGAKSAKALFQSAMAWTSFTRLIDQIDQLFAQDFGPAGTWQDSVTIRHREIWRGDVDHEMVAFCAVAPAHLDANPHQMQVRLKTELPCVSRLLKSIEESREMTKATVQTTAPPVAEIDAGAEGDPGPAPAEPPTASSAAPSKASAKCPRPSASSLRPISLRSRRRTEARSWTMSSRTRPRPSFALASSSPRGWSRPAR